jgi:hypothetical protein
MIMADNGCSYASLAWVWWAVSRPDKTAVAAMIARPAPRKRGGGPGILQRAGSVWSDQAWRYYMGTVWSDQALTMMTDAPLGAGGGSSGRGRDKGGQRSDVSTERLPASTRVREHCVEPRLPNRRRLA